MAYPVAMEPDLDQLAKAANENATSAQSVSSAAGSVSAHSLADQDNHYRFEASRRAARRGKIGIKIFSREGNTSG